MLLWGMMICVMVSMMLCVVCEGLDGSVSCGDGSIEVEYLL